MIYGRLPEFAQTAALNVYGLGNQRRLRGWTEVLAGLQASEHWSRELQIKRVADRLRTIVRGAVDDVPRYGAYRHLAPELEGPDADVLEILRELPVLTKEEIAAEPERLISRRFSRSKLGTTITSGTTGTPLRVFMEPQAQAASDALWWRRTVWAGYQAGDWIARLVGDPVVPLREALPTRPYRVSWTDRRIYLSSYHLGEATAEAMLEVLAQRRPAFVMGYPSTLDALARLATRDLGSWRPKSVLYSSEPLYAHQRDSIDRLFKAPLRGQYGCAERVVSASECAEGSYHLGLVDGYVEGQFAEVPADAAGRAIVTGLLSEAMPLLRYDLGDTLELQPDAVCRCGRTLPVIGPVVTKLEDVVVTPSGRRISPSVLTWAFKDLAGVRRSQIRQRRDFSIEVLVVVDQATSAAAFAPVLEQRLRDMTFHEVPVRVVEVEDLAMTEAGKTRFVVSARGEHRAGLRSHGSM